MSDQDPPQNSAVTPKPGYKLLPVEQVKDLAADHGLGEIHEVRFVAGDLETSQVGLAAFRVKPGQRQPFGHRHDQAEEVYVVTSGSGRAKLDDEIVELSEGDLLRVGPEITRCFEAGPDGLAYFATGQHLPGDGEIKPGWWTD